MTIPETMRAVVLTGHGGLDKLEIHNDWPVPKPGPGEVLVAGACGFCGTNGVRLDRFSERDLRP